MHGTVAMIRKPVVEELDLDHVVAEAAPDLDRVMLTPEMATHLLERNSWNRPISEAHVKRIAKQIRDGKWVFNGDTIKLADDDAVLDGQHRCWGVIEAKTPVETIIVRGLDRAAFVTIDTIHKHRSGGDVIALSGQTRYRTVVAGALTWLIRWQHQHDRQTLEKYKEPVNRIENSDIEVSFTAHEKGIVRAVERAMPLRSVANPSLMSFIYYVAANQNAELAEQMIAVIDDPGRMAKSHPLFQLRLYFISKASQKAKDPLNTIAVAFKALNAAHRGRQIERLMWKSQGTNAEAFPVLAISSKAKPTGAKTA